MNKDDYDSPFLETILKEFVDKVSKAKEQGMDFSILPLMPISGSLDEFVSSIQKDKPMLSVDARWFSNCSQIIDAFLEEAKKIDFFFDALQASLEENDPSAWYRSLPPEKQEVMDYFQMFEYTILNDDDVDVSWFRLSNPELLVSLGMDLGDRYSYKTVTFREALRLVARDIPEEWLRVRDTDFDYYDMGRVAQFRMNMKEDIAELIKEMDREHLRVIK